jgi:hypothetical protein
MASSQIPIVLSTPADAAEVARGLRACSAGMTCLPCGKRRATGSVGDGPRGLTIVEIKVSKADLLGDQDNIFDIAPVSGPPHALSHLLDEGASCPRRPDCGCRPL